jgi:hypothetical protein
MGPYASRDAAVAAFRRSPNLLTKPPIGDPCNGCGLCCRIRVCSIGSFAMALVDRFGDRVDGPCPALTAQDDGALVCGIVLRPKDFLRGAAHELREAVKLTIGAGAGCDEAGDEPDETADPKLEALQARYLARHGREKLQAAAMKIIAAREQ